MRCNHEGLGVLPRRVEEELKVEVQTRRGRFAEEYNMELYKGKDRVVTVKVFCGRSPYRGWVELYNIEEEPFREMEEELYKILYEALKPGESIYVDYSWDRETMRLVDMGIPAEATRIGFKLLTTGFTWFKVWYYPEGFMEGNIKIQAEKALDEKARARHVEEICNNIKTLTLKPNTVGDDIIRAALERALKVKELLGC